MYGAKLIFEEWEEIKSRIEHNPEFAKMFFPEMEAKWDMYLQISFLGLRQKHV